MELINRDTNRLCLPSFGVAEMEAASRVITSGWVGPKGSEVQAFSEELQTYFGGDKAVLLCNSGTSALHLGLMGLGVERGDIVLVQSFTYAATAFAAKYLGAQVFFIGSEPETWNMCPQALEEALKWCKAHSLDSKVKAIIPVHIYGHPANMKAINQVASLYNVPILEDAAEAFGSTCQGALVGAGPNLSAFSFNANKILSAAGGGLLISDDTALINKLRSKAHQSKSRARHFDHNDLGYNYGMSNLNAAIGRVQLTRIQQLLKRKQDIHKRYLRLLGPHFTFQKSGAGNHSNHWLNAIHGLNSKEIQGLLSQSAIEFGPAFIPLHLTQAFRGSPFFGDNWIESFSKELLLLPSGEGVDTEEVCQFLVQSLRL